MATRREILDEGRPDPEIVDGQLSNIEELQRYGLAFSMLFSPSPPSLTGTYLRRVPTIANAAVVGGSATLPNAGGVPAVQATAGGFIGPLVRIVTGAPAGGQYRIDYDGQGTPTIVTNGADAITQVSYEQTVTPAAFVAALDEEVG